MYVHATDLNKEVLYQGDLIKSFPFLIFDKEILPGTLDSNGEGKLEIKVKLGLTMVISQTCDIQYRENIIVCPVYRLQDFSFKKEEIDSIRKRRMGYWFYLPKLEGAIEESIADFQTLYYVSRSILDKYKHNKLVTLTDWGRHHLSYALSNYFGRPIESKD